MSEPNSAIDPSFLVKLTLGVVSAVLSAAIIASFAVLLSMSARLTVLETKEQQLRDAERDLNHRVIMLERVVYGGEDPDG